MALTPPTVPELKARLAAFAAVPDARIQLALNDAAQVVPVTWRAVDYVPAIILLAAHEMVLDGVLPGSSAAVGTPGADAPVASVSVGDVKVGFAKGGAIMSGGASWSNVLARTIYGQRFDEIRRRNTPRTLALVRA